MKRRLFLRLTDKERETFRRTRDVVLGASSYRSAVMALCDSALVNRLCLESLVETQLRRISVNLRQISRRVYSSGESDEAVLAVCGVLDPLVDVFSAEVSCIRSGGADGDCYRSELSVRMTADEKAVVAAVKRALQFRNYRSLILGLCSVVDNRIMPPDFSMDYQRLKEYGSDINTIAKSLNSGSRINPDQLGQFLAGFMQVLSTISTKITEV